MSYFHELERRWTRLDAVAVATDTTTRTYIELRERVHRAAGWLAARGIRSGDVVAIQMVRSIELLELHLACLGLGVAMVPLNDRYTAPEVSYMLQDSGCKLAVLADFSAEAIHEPPCPIATCSIVATELGRAALHPLDSVPSEQATAAICYTSGTTGAPKGAVIRHHNLAAMVRALHDAWRWSADDVLVHALPLFHIHGLFVAQHGALWANASAIWMARFDAGSALALLVAPERAHPSFAGRPTLFMGVPTLYQRFLELPQTHPDLSSVRLFTCGSAALPAHVHRAFARRFGHEILERYGMTEVGIVLSNPLDGVRRPGSVGRPLPGVDARVVDPDSGQPLDPGQVGEIRLRGPSVFAGYHGQPEKTAETFDGDWLKTGDLAWTDADGYFHIVGRSRDLVISGGFNVYPSEIESVVADHPSVAEVAVVGAIDADLGERVVATVVPKADHPLSISELVSHVAARLAPYKRPRAWRLGTELPRNSMGKVLKNVLQREWESVQVRDAEPGDAPTIARWNIAMAAETERLDLDPATARSGVESVFSESTGARYFVAEIASGLAGQCMVTIEWSDWRNRSVWWLQSVYVHPAFRRRGVFRHLYAHVVDEARYAGAAGVRLYVDRTNHDAASVYRTLGMNGDHYLVFEKMFDSPPVVTTRQNRYAPEAED